MNKIKVVLVSLPSPFLETPNMDIPLGLAYISSYIKSKGYNDVGLVDFNLFKYDYYNEDSYLKEVPIDVDVYGISVTTSQFFWYCKVVEYIKENNKDAIIISGGSHPTVKPLECLNRTKTDFVVQGEGEESFFEILESITSRKTSSTKIEGVSSHGNISCKRRIVKDINSLPFPDRTLVDVFDYKRTLKGERAFHVISARDCPFNCSFCSKKAVGRNVRFRNISNFMSEIDFYMKRYGISKYVIYDDTFTCNKRRAVDIAREMGKRVLSWRCFSRTNLVDYDTLKVFRENGLSSISFGVETFSEKMLRVYNKCVTVNDNKKAIKLCGELTIPVRCNLIYGGPYETRETLEDTIKGVKETQPDEWNVSTFIPIVGSDIGDNPEKYSIKIHQEDPFYLKYMRAGESGMGEILVDISTMSPEEYIENRRWFVAELEEVCPRRNIQDTIQTLKV